MPSPWEFKQHGQGGLRISGLFPRLAEHADDLCLLNGMHSSVPAHPQSFLQLHTGSFQFVRPSMGAWVLYGLGTENQNLPGFISLCPPDNVGGAQNYAAPFCRRFTKARRSASSTKTSAPHRCATSTTSRSPGSCNASNSTLFSH